MATVDTTGNGVGQWGMLARERIIAKPGFNRWLVPPAALAIHLCIGMAYGFSVFWLPLTKQLPGASACARGDGFPGVMAAAIAEMTATDCNWNIATLGWMFALFFLFLGCSAAPWGG